ncbi:DUF6206 family protein [Mycolicibacterium sp.]|uniref:DUF6206 family protein n=1 Tax=Mycolicibacterium sp. TaxID=2320850 RepID=UPI003D11D36E
MTELDTALHRAQQHGTAGALPVIGFGEVTTVIAWPPTAARRAVKVLPPFQSQHQLTRYRDVVAKYVSQLAEHGVVAVPSSVVEVAGGAGYHRAVMVQPLGRVDRLLSRVLDDSRRPEATRLLEQLVGLVIKAVDADTGLDAQVSNWIVADDGALRYLDVTTPLMGDDDSLSTVVGPLVCSVYPAVLRPVLRRFVVPSVVKTFHHVETVLVDIGGNLLREGLDRHVPALVDAARAYGIHLDPRSLWRYHRADRRVWRTLKVLKSLDRSWNQRVRRRPYPFLLSEGITWPG